MPQSDCRCFEKSFRFQEPCSGVWHRTWWLMLLYGIWMAFPFSCMAMDLRGNGAVTVSDSDVYDSVYGRLQQGKDGVMADGNRVSVTGGSISRGIYGGAARSSDGSATADGNTVLISGGLSGFDYTIYGGNARSSNGSAEANANSVSIAGIPDLGSDVSIYGGYAQETSGRGTSVLAMDNMVEIGNEVDLYMAVGGRAIGSSGVPALARADSNAVTISGGSVNLLYGGFATADGETTASNNTVILNSGNVDMIVGGDAYSRKGNALADSNTILVRGGDIQSVFGGSVQSDYGTASASNNRIEVSGAVVNGSVSGGFAPQSSVPATVGNNTIIISRGAVVMQDVHGGDVTGSTEGSQADGNILTIAEGGEVNGTVAGGWLEAAGSASHNTILVQGGTVTGDIYGGNGGAGGVAVQNSIIIAQNAQLGSGISLYGGAVGEGRPVAASGTGNTLFVDSWQGSVSRVAGFENIHFVLPAPGAPVDIPMLTVTAAQAGDFSGTTVTAQLPDIITGGQAHVGEVFTLLEDTSGAVAEAQSGELVSLQQGYVSTYDGLLVNTGTSIELQLTGVQLNPRVAALNEARAASTAVINRGGDLAAGIGLRRACAAAESAEREGNWTSFWALTGGQYRYHTGSWADTEGFSLMTGAAKQVPVSYANLFLGAFFEFGVARLDTLNDSTGGSVAGHGDSRYAGGGLLARAVAEEGPLAGWYVEGSVRMGTLDTSWQSYDLRDNMDRHAEYDTQTPYYGGHLSLGRRISLGEHLLADLYGSGFWTHQEGEGVDMNGEKVDFDGVDSRRLRLGARFEYSLTDNIRPYLDAAWEREFDGTARSVAQDFSIPASSLEGNSGIFELGLNMMPDDSGLNVDIALQLSTGVQDGVGGMLHASYTF